MVYWPGLLGGFAFDDHANIVDNTALRIEGGSLLSVAAAAASSGAASPMGRPISMVSFALNYFFFGTAPFSFKLTNLFIHYANALLVIVLILQMVKLSQCKVSAQRAFVLASSVAAIWALHPLNAMPVLHVVQRMTSLSAFFMLIGLSLYLYGRSVKSSLGICAIAASLLVCWPAAIYSKETGLLLPVYILLCEWLLLGSFLTTSKKVLLLMVLPAVGLLIGICWANWEWIVGGYRMRDFTLYERLYTEPRVLWFYVQQILLPMPGLFGLYHDDITVSRGLVSPPTTLFAIAGGVAIVTFAYLQRRRRPLFTFAVFWFLASHLLESTILPLEIAHEHRNYLASVGILLWLTDILLPVEPIRQRSFPRLVVLLGFISLCGLVTSLRSSQWSEDFNRRQVEVFNHPLSARANYEFATGILNNTFDVGHGNLKAYELAHMHLERAAALDLSAKAALIGVLYLDCAAGKPKDAKTTAKLLARFATTSFTHGDRGVVRSLSAMLVEQKLCMEDAEVKSLIDAGLSNPSLDGSLRGMIFAVAMDYAVMRIGSMPLAIEYAQAAVVSDPAAGAPRINLIHLYLQSGKVDEARQEYTQLMALPAKARDRADLEKLKSLFEAKEHDATPR